jgi:hypothetical protein
LHVLPDGRVIVHSHPYSQDNGGRNHGHSSSDYAVWGAFAKVLQVDLANSPTFGGVSTLPLWRIEPTGPSGLSSLCPPTINPRAPPATSNL